MEKIQIWLKLNKNIGHFARRPKNVLLLTAALNCYKNCLFYWKGIRLLEWQKRYKYYAKAPQYYVTRILSILFLQLK